MKKTNKPQAKDQVHDLISWMEWLSHDPFTALAAHAAADLDFLEAFDFFTGPWIPSDFSDKLAEWCAEYGDSQNFTLYEDQFVKLQMDQAECFLMLYRLKSETSGWSLWLKADIHPDWDSENIKSLVEKIIETKILAAVSFEVLGYHVKKDRKKSKKEPGNQLKLFK